MAELDPNQVRRSMKRLREARSALFGADAHHFVLNPPLLKSEVHAFEQRHHISLPADYRHFITHLANGGAGPYYGVFPLGQRDSTGKKLDPWHEKDGLVGVLSEPFPLRDAWNDLSGLPSEDLMNTNLEEGERQLAAFEKIYWDTARVNGAFPICHMGCALRIWLVVSGDEAGHLWLDRRADDNGLSPIILRNKLRATFDGWYQEWLDDALQSLW